MARYTRPFGFAFPLQHKIVRNLKIVTERVGELWIEGTATFDPSVSVLSHLDERYATDIDFVKWNGADIKPVLELTGLIDDIQEASLRHCTALFEDQLPHAA